MIDPSLIEPRRRNRLVDYVQRLFVREEPDKGPQPTQQDSTMTGTTAYSVQSIFDKYFVNDIARLAIYRDVQEMDDTGSEEASTALDTIADNVCSSEDGAQTSIEVLCQDERANKEIQDLLTRIDLHKKLYAIVRGTLKFGDTFVEPVVNGEGEIAAIKILPPNTMFRNEDRFGNLKQAKPKYDAAGDCQSGKEECAYTQADPQTQNVVAAFYPWQIIHFRHNWDGMSAYGRSMLKLTRVVWRKLKAEEEGVIIGRLTRAYMKLVYKVDTTGLSLQDKLKALAAFRDNMTQRQNVDSRRESQFSVMSDIYLSSGNLKMGNQIAQEQTSVETLDPKNEGLQNIGDMEYFHRKMLSTVRVPPAHMGFEKDVNAKATLTLQDVQYVRFLRRVQQTVGGGLEQLIDTQLILKGFTPKDVVYVIRWPRLSATDEAVASLAEMQRAQGDQVYLQERIISSKFVQRTRFSLDDEAIQEMDAEIEEDIKKDQELAQSQADLQIGIKNAAVKAVSAAKGSNNGGNTRTGDPGPGGRSHADDRGPQNANPGARATIGVNPPTKRALRQEMASLLPAFVATMERYAQEEEAKESEKPEQPIPETHD